MLGSIFVQLVWLTLLSPCTGPPRPLKHEERCKSGLRSSCSQRLYWFDELPEVLQYNKYVRSGYRAREAILSPASLPQHQERLCPSPQWECPPHGHKRARIVLSHSTFTVVCRLLCVGVCMQRVSAPQRDRYIL